MGASWYKDYANPTYEWKYRAVITVDVGTATGSRDAQITIPKDWDLFWDNVRSAGEDVRVTSADGVTLVTFDLAAGFSTTTRTGVIEIDNYTVPGTGSRVYVLYVYWGQASCSSGLTSFSPSSPDTGYIALEQPYGRLITTRPQRPGDTVLRDRVSKRVDEDVFIWFRLTDLLHPRRDKFFNRLGYEGIATVTWDVQTGGASQAGMFSVPSIRVVETDDGDIWARCTVDDGSESTDYAVIVTITTTLGQALQGGGIMQVRNADET